jgi:hypothetical protein
MRAIVNRGFGMTQGRDLDSFPHALAACVLVSWLSASSALQGAVPLLAKRLLQDDESIIAHAHDWNQQQEGGYLVLRGARTAK